MIQKFKRVLKGIQSMQTFFSILCPRHWVSLPGGNCCYGLLIIFLLQCFQQWSDIIWLPFLMGYSGRGAEKSVVEAGDQVSTTMIQVSKELPQLSTQRSGDIEACTLLLGRASVHTFELEQLFPEPKSCNSSTLFLLQHLNLSIVALSTMVITHSVFIV